MSNRRQFLLTSSTAVVAVRRTAWTAPPARPVRLAAIGIGGRGRQNIQAMSESGLAKFVALVDIDLKHPRAIETLQREPGATTFTDFRRMFDARDREIDAVVITTPDHSHFPIAMEAIRRGKHVYCEKPLCNTFRETDLLMTAAERAGVVTQMGNQGHSGANYFQAATLAQDGIFDAIRNVTAYACHRKAWSDWTINNYRSQPKPEHIDWDSWLATRPSTPFSETLHPGRWRAWQRFGGGIIGDWGSHLLDTAHRFMELGLPESIATPRREGANEWIFPHTNTVRMSFPARGDRPPAMITWHDGYEGIPADAPLQANGKKMIAAKVFEYRGNRLIGGSHEAPLRLESAAPAEVPALNDYPEPTSNHQVNFLRACLGTEEARSPFSIGGPLTQMLLLGVIAQRLGGVLQFDRRRRCFHGERADQANELLRGPDVRAGWAEFYD